MDLPSDPNGVYYRSHDQLQFRPILTGADAKETFDSIPEVDISQVFSPDLEVRKALAKEIGLAAEKVGFMYMINPPIEPKKMEDAFAVLQRFFILPEETKLKYHVNNSPAAKGFTPVDHSDKRKGFGGHRETFGMGNDYSDPEQHMVKVAAPGSIPLNQWPDDDFPEFRKVLYSYFQDVFVLAKQLVGIFALALDLEENALDDFFKAPLTDVTVQHYLPHDEEIEARQVLYPHADYGAFTLLLQHDVGGLQVLNANAIWVPAPVKEHAFVVNTGSYFEVISGGRWRSTVHRVCAKPNTERMSLPFFFSPDPSCTIRRMVPAVDESLEDKQTAIGPAHVRGMFADRQDHPYIKKLRGLGLTADNFTYDMISQPPAWIKSQVA